MNEKDLKTTLNRNKDLNVPGDEMPGLSTRGDGSSKGNGGTVE